MSGSVLTTEIIVRHKQEDGTFTEEHTTVETEYDDKGNVVATREVRDDG